MTSSENVILPKDPKDTDSWDLYGKYKQYASPVIKTISNKKVLSPEERKEDILTFIKKSYIPSIGNIVTESYTKT
ncbi:MAG: hypothetical protein LBI53_07870 [Candidatus Peribacteria bacterium]|jgi:hypothetical protein|nr:hypothetical protein [Candidatus Peribacteria bacterium]